MLCRSGRMPLPVPGKRRFTNAPISGSSPRGGGGLGLGGGQEGGVTGYDIAADFDETLVAEADNALS